MRKFLAMFLAAATAVFACFFVGCEKNGQERSTYRIRAEYDEEKGEVSAVLQFCWKNDTGRSAPELAFNLYGNAFREGARYKPVSPQYASSAYYAGESYGEMRVNRVSGCNDWEIGGKDANVLLVRFAEPVGEGAFCDICIEYVLKLAKVNHRTGIAARSVNLGNFYPIACVYENGAFAECEYDAVGDPFYSACADYYVSFTADEKYSFAASGACVSAVISGGKRTNEYRLCNARDFALVIGGEYELLQGKSGDTPILYYYYDDGNAKQTLSILQDAVSYFSRTYGEYPYETYTAVQTGFCYGGMEYPGLSMLSDNLSASGYAYTAVHETAHQWWYAAGGSDPRVHAWQDEGLAEYSAALFFGSHDYVGLTFSGLCERSRHAYKTYADVQKRLFGKVDTSMDRKLSEYESEFAYVNIAYHKGLMLFDSLRSALGDKRFFGGLKKYYSEYGGKIAAPEDFVRCFSGKGAKDVVQSYVQGGAGI